MTKNATGSVYTILELQAGWKQEMWVVQALVSAHTQPDGVFVVSLSEYGWRNDAARTCALVRRVHWLEGREGGQAFDEPSSIAQVSPTQLHPWRRQVLFIDKQVQMMMMMSMEWRGGEAQ